MTYTPPTRNQIFEALKAKGAAITWGDGETFRQVSRRVVEWSVADKPALFQSEVTEKTSTDSNLGAKRIWSADWNIMYDYAADEAAVPAEHVNDILDAVEAGLSPTPTDPGWINGRLTLGGMVSHVWIDGDIVKIPGDLDNQGLLVVPISILVP